MSCLTNFSQKTSPLGFNGAISLTESSNPMVSFPQITLYKNEQFLQLGGDEAKQLRDFLNSVDFSNMKEC